MKLVTVFCIDWYMSRNLQAELKRKRVDSLKDLLDDIQSETEITRMERDGE